MSYHLRMQELVLRSGCSWASQVQPTKPSGGEDRLLPKGPFSGLTICVTGLSKEARKQVQVTTERLGGAYSPDLHSGCTHLVVQLCVFLHRSTGRKFEQALKNRYRKGLFVVTLAWFVNSARLNERLDESQFDATRVPPEVESAEKSLPPESDDPLCMPQKTTFTSLVNLPPALPSRTSLEVVPGDFHKSRKPLLYGYCFYIDKDVPSELQIKVVEAVVREGATCLSDWYIGCNATHIVCEDHALFKYVGYKMHLVSPIWLLRSVKEYSLQFLVQISLDLVRHLPYLLEQNHLKRTAVTELGNTGPQNKKLLALCSQEDAKTRPFKLEEAEAKIRAAKESIRRRRGPSMQPCRALPRPITPQSMMESICWSISEPPSTAQLYLDSSDGAVGLYDQASDYFDAQESGKDGGNEVYVRPLSESEKEDLVYNGTFLTILFPLDRFSEMGPSSKQFFSEQGFTRQQILEIIYAFYQEPLSTSEIEVAIHTDSKHADRLRAVYAAPETLELGYVQTKRYEFLGSRRNFDGLRRLSVEKNGQVYQLCLGS